MVGILFRSSHITTNDALKSSIEGHLFRLVGGPLNMYSSCLFPFNHLNYANLMENMYTSICTYVQDNISGEP